MFVSVPRSAEHGDHTAGFNEYSAQAAKEAENVTAVNLIASGANNENRFGVMTAADNLTL